MNVNVPRHGVTLDMSQQKSAARQTYSSSPEPDYGVPTGVVPRHGKSILGEQIISSPTKTPINNEVEDQLSLSHHLTSRLSECIAELEDRLNAVLSPDTPVNSTKADWRVCESIVGQRLSGVNATIDEQITRIRQVTSRICL